MADFSEFQLKEYENISQAHFKTNELVAAFFRYYLLIMAIPITAFGAIFATDNNSETIAMIITWHIPAGIFLFVFCAMGFFLMSYVIGLMLDVILYARTVNSVRDYFYCKIDSKEIATNTLPRDPRKPDFYKFGSNFFIVLSFTILNTFYLTSGVTLLALIYPINTDLPSIKFHDYTTEVILIAIAFSVISHLAWHWKLCKNKETKYSQL